MSKSKKSRPTDILESLYQESSEYVLSTLITQVSPNEIVTTYMRCCYDLMDFLHHENILEQMYVSRNGRAIARLREEFFRELGVKDE